MKFVTIEVPSWRTVVTASEWPKDLRWVLEAYKANWKEWDKEQATAWGEAVMLGSPRFYLAHEGKLVQVATGTGLWRSKMLPTITRLFGT